MTVTKEKKRWVGYTLYGILLTIVLLYYRFPSETLRGYLLDMAESLYPGLEVSIDTVSPSLPFGLKLHGTQISSGENPGKALLIADDLTIHPKVRSLFQGRYEFDFNCSAYNGILEGHFLFENDLLRLPFEATAAFKSVRLNRSSILSDLMGVPIEGIFNGTVSYRGNERFPGNNTGEAAIKISDCRVDLSRPILSITSLDFNNISAQFVLNRQRLTVKSVEFSGRDMNGSLSGRINLKREILDSYLDLRGTIEPFADLVKNLTGSQDLVKLFGQQSKQGKLSFTIRGTIQRPRLKFI